MDLVGDLVDSVSAEEPCGENVSRVNLSSHWDSEAFANTAGVAVVYVVLFMIGVPLNTYILAVLIYKKLFNQPTYLLLLNLTVSDLLVCLFPLLFKIITTLNQQGSLGNTDFVRCNVCNVGATFIIFNTSIYLTLMLLSIERLIFFRTPLRYDNLITTKRIVIAIVVEWVVSVAIAIPVLAGYGDLLYSLVCGHIFVTPYHIERGLVYAFLTGVFFALVTAVIVICNVWMVILFVKIYSKRKKVRVSSSFGSQNQSGQQHRVLTAKRKRFIWSLDVARRQCAFIRTFGAIIFINCASVVPSLVLGAMIFFTVEIPLEYIIFVEAALLSQTSTHPLVQALFAPELQKLLFQCTRLKKSKLGQCIITNCENCCTSEFMMTEMASKLSKLRVTFSETSSEASVNHHGTAVASTNKNDNNH